MLCFFTRISYGIASSFWDDDNDDDAMYINNQYGFLLGKANSHFEVSIGPCYWRYRDGHDWDTDFPGIKLSDGYLFFPFPAVGWRYQKPDGHFVFRTGLSLPEAIYAGVGFVF